jgi:tetratricopeptide (TPR) repeat protein/TolB-like protein/DNA-binding winged helix-turn-helix (wHTH) protein
LGADLLQGYYLGDLLVEPAKARITGREGSTHLHSRAAEVLLCLAARPGEVLSRAELRDAVWGTGQGSDEALTHAVSELRHALSDQADDPRFIQTLPRRGYRLLVTPVPAGGDEGSIVLGAGDGAGDLGVVESLNRRGVFETALAYLILGWLLIQVADVVFGQLHFPEWVGTFVTALVIAGFPIALVLSWFLEFRHGRAVLDPVSPADARRRRFGRTYLSVISSLAIAAIGVFAYDRFVGLPGSEPSVDEVAAPEPALPPVLENSIAVIPFLNADGSEETQIIADGLAEDVIAQLSRIPGLRVSSLGDSSTLDPNASSKQVRERLRVAMYLQGRVQGLDDKLDVTVRLIDTDSGFHILSREFNQPIENFFGVRDEITRTTVANVRVALPAGTQAITRIDDDPVLDAYLLYRRGLEALRQYSENSVDEALRWFDAALDVDPDYAAAHAGKCTAYTLGYRATDDAMFIDLAEASCAKALQLNANLDIIYTALGQLYVETGRYADAENAYLMALDTSPSNVDALTGLGETYNLMQEPDKAEQMLSQAIGLHPGDWGAYNALGNFLFSSGRYREAARQYETVVALDNGSAAGWANLGTAYMLAADFTSAAPAFEKAIELEPRSTFYSNLGLMRYYLGDFAGAIEAHRRATELSPGNYLAWSNLGDAYYASGRGGEAREAFATALEVAQPHMDVNPNDPGLLMDLAWIRAMLGDEKMARSMIGRALTIAPDDPYAHYIDALIHLESGNTDASLNSLEHAVDAGYPVDMLAAEPHLRPLRDNAKFIKLIS